MNATDAGEDGRRSRISQDLAGGCFLVAIGAVGIWQSLTLELGTLTQLGPGMLPLTLAGLTTALGGLIALRSLHGTRMERWTVRGPLLIAVAAFLFAFAVRPLGFVIAGPGALLLAAAANREVRWLEIGIFAVVATAFCVLLFRILLGLPVPVAPWWLGY